MTQEQKALPSIVVLSHGELAKALLSSASMVFGSEARINTYALCLDPEEDPDDYLNRVKTLLEGEAKDALLLIDLHGGTPFNTVLKLSREHIPMALTGVSLPMLMEALGCRTYMKGDELLNAVWEASKSLSTNITEILTSRRQQVKYAQ